MRETERKALDLVIKLYKEHGDEVEGSFVEAILTNMAEERDKLKTERDDAKQIVDAMKTKIEKLDDFARILTGLTR